jgi:hypothetical protein
MTLEKFIKDNHIHIPYGDRWLVWDDRRWYIFERPYHKKNTITLYEGEDINEALRILIK